MPYATEDCHVTDRRHAHTVTPARAPEWLLLSCKRLHACRETCTCTQSVRAQMSAPRLSQPLSDFAGAHNGMFAPVYANDPRDAQPVWSDAAFACEGTLAWDN
eukprot:3372492-Pleurochrysis_carterae.AAC.1